MAFATGNKTDKIKQLEIRIQNLVLDIKDTSGKEQTEVIKNLINTVRLQQDLITRKKIEKTGDQNQAGKNGPAPESLKEVPLKSSISVEPEDVNSGDYN
jgi:hypothetical protein